MINYFGTVGSHVDFKEIFAQDKKYVFHCASGWRSALTVATLQDMGFDAAHLKEGFSTWEKHGGPIEYHEDKGKF